jgi:hypothetical protein
MRTLLTLLLCCVPATLYAAPPEISHITASYNVFTKGIQIATINEEFIRTGNRYHIESLTKPVGLLALFKPDTLLVTSDGEVTAQGLRPQHFVYKRSQDTNKDATATFDWAQSSVFLDYNDGARSVPLLPDTQDRLSALYQFRYEPSLHERKELVMPITDGRKMTPRHYLIQTGKTLTLPAGKLKTLYLSTPPEATQWKTEIWLSVANGNFPCKIIVTEDNGDQLTQVLTALSFGK